MMAPTERSMPAVRITSVCAMPSDGDDGHLLEDQRQVEGREEFGRRRPSLKKMRPRRRTMNGIVVGKACRKCWMRRKAVLRFLVEDRDARRRCPA